MSHKLLFLIIGLVWFCVPGSGRVLSQGIRAFPIDPPTWIATTIGGDTVQLCDPEGMIVAVFFNHYSCRDYFGAIDSMVRRIREAGVRLRVFAVVRVPGGIVGSRRAQRAVHLLMPHVDSVLFDPVDSSQDPWPPGELKGGLFGLCNVSKTPVVVISHSGASRVFDYDAVSRVTSTSRDDISEIEQALYEFSMHPVPR